MVREERGVEMSNTKVKTLVIAWFVGSIIGAIGYVIEQKEGK